MTKTLKNFLEVYKPKSPDEQKFVDKHVVIKHSDRNGNGDDVFKGNTKYIKRKEERKGYDVGEDEKVYEETDIDESYEELKRLKGNIERNEKKMKSIPGIHPEKKRLATQIERDTKKHKELFNKYWGKNEEVEVNEDTFTDASLANLRVMKHKQEMKKIESSSKLHPLMKVRKLSDAKKKLADLEKVRDHYVAKHEKAESKKKKIKEDIDLETLLDEALDLLVSIDEKTLTPAEMKKREEVVKAIKRENPKMDKSMAYAVATKTAKRVAEEAEELDELSKETKASYMNKAGAEIDKHWDNSKKDARSAHKYYGRKNTMRKIANEEVEELDELSFKKLADYSSKSADSVSGAPVRKQDNRIKGQSLADKKIRKMDGYSSTAKVAATHEGYVPTADEPTEADKKTAQKVRDMLAKEKKPVKEETLDELSRATIGRYSMKAKSIADNEGGKDRTKGRELAGRKRWGGTMSGVEKAKVMASEEAEQIDELSKKTLGRYVYKATSQVGEKGITAGLKIQNNERADKELKTMGKRQKGVAMAAKKLTKEDIINRAVDKYVPEEIKYTAEERLLKRLDGLSEAHVSTLLGLFEALNKDNQNKMIETVETREGINSLLNFALENRGE
jgi:hypothetical protein